MGPVRPVDTVEEKKILAEIAERLSSDERQLIAWVDKDIERFQALAEQAAGIRGRAHALVRDNSEQGLSRQRREESLRLAAHRAHLTFEELSADRPALDYLCFAEKPALERDGVGREWGRGREGDWEAWVRRSTAWPTIEAASRKLLVVAESQRHRQQRARQATRHALSQMQLTVDRAREWSALFFAPKPAAPSFGFAKSAMPPLFAFVLVSLAGIWLKPDPFPGWITVGVLIAVAVSSALITARHGYRASVVATLATGSALATFTAAYLACRLLEPGSVQLTSKALAAPIRSIAEASFTSLTVGLTGGTIGIELHGAARVVAFIQILVSLAAVLAGLAWAWDHLLEHTRRENVAAPTLRELDTGQ
jgi:hypothetical protein